MFKVRRYTEYEIHQLDIYGDIQEIEFYDSLRDARRDKAIIEKETKYSSVELWRCRYTYKDYGDIKEDSNKYFEEEIT